ncbi:alpha/beta hydrolase [Limimaricola variabilis]
MGDDMAVTARALADLRFGLRFAADRYLQFSQADDLSKNGQLFLSLANERLHDADALDEAAVNEGYDNADPTIKPDPSGRLLGLYYRKNSSSISIAYSVQRAENTLKRMAAQLESFADPGHVQMALRLVRDRIEQRREAVREARRRAQQVEGTGGGVSRTAYGGSVEGQEVIVWYGTNRGKDGSGQFAALHSPSISYGRCSVFVPSDRKVGSLGDGIFNRIFLPRSRIEFTDFEQVPANLFWSMMKSEVDNLDDEDRHGLVFIHGYNTNFRDAARRTAQLKVDLGHRGATAFFSWPSVGGREGYTGYSGDEAAIEGSELPIQNFLVDFAQRSGVAVVHVIAHSMGNRGLLRAMDAIHKTAASATPIRFGQIFLAAPDVDSILFSNLASAYAALSLRATLYVTNNDKAIGLSRQLHRSPRVGLVPPVSILPGIDTVDASHVNIGLMGHSYATETGPVLADIHELIKSDTPPGRRFGLKQAVSGGASYWEFVRRP